MGTMIVMLLMPFLMIQQNEESSAQATTQPTSQPQVRIRRPAQAEVYRDLLRQEDERIERMRATATLLDGDVPQSNSDLIPEGTQIRDRVATLVKIGDASAFEFAVDGESESLLSLEILPNTLLELVEARSERGDNRFQFSGEVTRYRNANYLLLQRVVRVIPHGNVSP